MDAPLEVSFLDDKHIFVVGLLYARPRKGYSAREFATLLEHCPRLSTSNAFLVIWYVTPETTALGTEIVNKLGMVVTPLTVNVPVRVLFPVTLNVPAVGTLPAVLALNLVLALAVVLAPNLVMPLYCKTDVPLAKPVVGNFI